MYNESYIGSILLNKLQPSWLGFLNEFMHKIDFLDHVGGYNTIKIEEANWIFSKGLNSHKDQVYLTNHSDSPKKSKSSHSSPRGRQFPPKGKSF